MVDFRRYEKFLNILKNKYVLTTILFLLWISFFDTNSLYSRYKYKQELDKLESEKEYYLNEIEKNQADMHELMSDHENLEKFAREKYLMKKEDEEIFLIIHDETPDTE